MTIDEAIKILKDGELNPCVTEDREACDMAIKALEEKTCEDAVSREDVIKAVDRHTFNTDDGLCLDEDITIILEEVAPKQDSILDKVRAEIEQLTDTMGVSYNQYVSKIDVLKIIDKYKAESEG